MKSNFFFFFFHLLMMHSIPKYCFIWNKKWQIKQKGFWVKYSTNLCDFSYFRSLFDGMKKRIGNIMCNEHMCASKNTFVHRIGIWHLVFSFFSFDCSIFFPSQEICIVGKCWIAPMLAGGLSLGFRGDANISHTFTFIFTFYRLAVSDNKPTFQNSFHFSFISFHFILFLYFVCGSDGDGRHWNTIKKTSMFQFV